MQKKRRQFTQLALGGAMLALAAGFPQASLAGEPGKLLVWINGDKGYNGLQQIGDEFARKTGITVKVEHPEDAPAKFQQAAAAGKGPDIWIWAHDRIGEWIQSGLLEQVTPGKAIKDSIDPIAWKAFTTSGKTWGYPISIEAVALVYNKDLVHTPPKSFDEVLELDKKLSAQGKKAILWDFTNTYFTWGLIAANGGYPFKAKADGSYDAKDVGVNNRGAVQGVETVVKLIQSGAMPKTATYADMEAQMAQGKVAMMINGPWSWDNLKDKKINFGVAPIPAVGNKGGSPFVGVLGAMINKSSPNKELAVEFIENHMLSVNGLKKIDADKPLGVPANKAFFAELKSNPMIQATMASAEAGRPMPTNPEMGKFWSAMSAALQNITQGKETAKEGLDKAAARIVN